MRSVDDAIVAIGPALRFIRGILFAIAFYPLREVLFRRKNGWLITWLVLVMLGGSPHSPPRPARSRDCCIQKCQ